MRRNVGPENVMCLGARRIESKRLARRCDRSEHRFPRVRHPHHHLTPVVERYANVRPDVRERLDWLGRERALTYKTLVLTGLRKGELASLTVAHLRLDGAVPNLTLDAADEKNRGGNDIPLRDDLAAADARLDLGHAVLRYDFSGFGIVAPSANV